MANPIAAILTQMRHALIDPRAPTAVRASAATSAADPAWRRGRVFALGFWVFKREAPRIAENL